MYGPNFILDNNYINSTSVAGIFHTTDLCDLCSIIKINDSPVITGFLIPHILPIKNVFSDIGFFRFNFYLLG